MKLGFKNSAIWFLILSQLVIAPNAFSGGVRTFYEDKLKVGNPANSGDKVVEFDLGSGTANPKMKYGTSDATLEFANDGVNFTPIGKGNGGSINYITNSDFENTATGYNTFADAAQAVPVDGTGGSPTHITIARSTSTPLRGKGSLLVSNSGSSSAQGEGFSFDFTIDSADQARVQTISFDYITASGTFVAGSDSVNSDVNVYIYDKTNSIIIQPDVYKLSCSSTTISCTFKGTFQPASNSTSYRIIWNVAGTNTSAWALKIDNVSVGPGTQRSVTPVSDWAAFTCSGTWNTNVAYTCYQKRVGDTLQVQFSVDLTGAPNNTALDINIPSGLSIDTTKLSTGAGHLGIASLLSNNIEYVGGRLQYNSATSMDVIAIDPSTGQSRQLSTTIPNTFKSGDFVRGQYAVPILGWSSSVMASTDTSSRVVAISYQNTAGTALSTGGPVAVPFATKSYDTHSAFVTDTFTAPVSGKYRLSANLETQAVTFTTTQGLQLNFNNNGSSEVVASTNGTGGAGNLYTISASKEYDLLAGQTLKVEAGASTAVSLNTNSGRNYINISRIMGPELLTAADTIACKYNASTTSIANNSNAGVSFTTLVYDRTGSCPSGVFTAWVPGLYEVSACIAFTGATWSSDGAIGEIGVLKNGSTGTDGVMQSNTFTPVATSSVQKTLCGTTTKQLLSGDTLQIYGFQTHNSSTALTLNGSAAYNWVTYRRVGN